MRASTRELFARAFGSAAALGLVRLALCWVPASTSEAWPARTGDLVHALPTVLALALACVPLALAVHSTRARRGLSARALRAAAGVPLVLAALGWPALLPLASLAPSLASEPFHALAALCAALLAARHVAGAGRSLPFPSATFALAAVIALAALATERVERDLPALQREVLELSLLERPDLWKVVREDAAHPVRAASFAANTVTQFDSGTLPVLELAPPAAVRIAIPPTSPDAVLRLAAGIAADSYTSSERHEVVLEALFEGRSVLAAHFTTHSGAPAQRRTWQRAEVPVGAGGTLVLRSSFDGDPSAAPRAGFGLLQVVRPVEAPRSLASRRRPNAIVVLIDTLRADRLSATTSPALVELGRRGTVFETAYSAASWTWPSTASLLTSLTPPEHGVLDQTACYLADELATLPEALQEAGFTTAAFSSNPLVSADKNFDEGFETFREFHWETAPRVLAEAEEWLRANGHLRFFLYVHLIDPHGPYEPEEDLALALGRPPPPGYSPERHKELVDRLRRSEPVDLDEARANGDYLASLYDGEVATADRALARFFATLASLGLDQRTVVAVTSDHGEEFLEHGLFGHGRQVHRESVHVPLVLAGPGVPRGRRVSLPVENRFLAPTLLDLCGVAPLANLAGRPHLLDPADVARQAGQPIFFGSDLGWWPGAGSRPLRAVLDGERFLVWSPARAEGESDLVALFDLERDPAATRDISAEEPEEVARLEGLVRAWLAAAEAIRPSALGRSDDKEVRAMLLDLGYIAED